jgi:hypothetical protein
MLCFDTRLPTFFFIVTGIGDDGDDDDDDDDNNDCNTKESTSIFYIKDCI